MDATDLMNSYFGAAGTRRLGQEAGLDGVEAERILRAGLPLQLAALAEHARTPEGQDHLREAVQNLPGFSDVEAALNEPGGAENLGQAGELLGPVLLGEQTGRIVPQVAGEQDLAGVQKLLNMALPLLLSFLGQRGVLAGNMPALLSDLGGSFGVPSTALLAVERGDTSTAAGLAEFLRGQFRGPLVDRLGRAAGFTGSTASRAAQAALPVILAGLLSRGSTEAGAADLLTRSRESERLLGVNGELNADLLSDQAELARIEGQGRGLLGTLFPNVDALTGRFGSATGGSGSSAGRLLALLAPLVLALVGSRARAGGLNATGLSTLLGGLQGRLPDLLPPGLSSLNALLKPAAPAPAPAAEPTRVETVATAIPQVTTTPPAPRAEIRPPATSAPAPTRVTTTTTTPRRRRSGFPWWILLPLLLGGAAWWFSRSPSGTSVTGSVPARSVTVTTPAPGATLPAEDFVMGGSAAAGDTLTIQEGDQSVATTEVGSDGTWQVAVPAPAPGEHTYRVTGKNSGARTELKMTAGGAGATAGQDTTAENSADTSGAAGDDGAPSTSGAAPPSGQAGSEDGTSATPGTFAITGPAEGTQLPAGGFTLRGTGNPGGILQVLEDGTSLGNATVAEDGTWSLDVPSPAAGAHTYAVQDSGGQELGQVALRSAAAQAGAGNTCAQNYTLSITDGQTVNQPFRFGGVGGGKGYAVTVKRDARVVGTKNVPLDTTCGWSYQSKPGAGKVTYEVRAAGATSGEPLSTVTLTVKP
ncbi:DUF937 domain-containing protein [Deinococcus hopiensis]|uniref:Ig-like domain (Group 3) n=1 Tax=Deinococcus hopiensis KR-140 TaxID=695939 RepID=A0A1W1V9P9_9DEIO|nr:DUF937 domain-containing protein [Deinococcus hopiensis]SMB90112.1 Ig-like domain (group 3) [Deinococcus hopiensis KR-140]